MLCDDCGKNNARLHYTQIVNGRKMDKHLCEKCARAYSASNYNMTLPNIMTGFLSNQVKKEAIRTEQCSECQLTYDSFRRDGKLGCEKCYQVFSDRLAPLLSNIHPHTVHKGKIPQNSTESLKRMRQLENLKEQLEKAISDEAFEEAAKLRDEIREIEKNGGGSK